MTTTTHTTATPAAPQSEEAQYLGAFNLEGIEDGSHVLAGHAEDLSEVLEDVRSSVGDAVKQDAKVQALCRKAARAIVAAGQHMVNGKGRPIYNLSSAPQVFLRTVGNEAKDADPNSILGSVLKDVDQSDRTRIMGRIRAFRMRNYTYPAMAVRVIADNGGDAQFKLTSANWVERVKGDPLMLVDPPSALRKLLAAECKAHELEVPAEWGGEKKKPLSAKTKQKGTAALDQAVQAMGETEKGAVAFHAGAVGLFRLVSSFAERVEDPDQRKDVDKRPETVALLLQVAEVATLASKVLAGNATAEDVKVLGEIRFDAKRDKLPA